MLRFREGDHAVILQNGSHNFALGEPIEILEVMEENTVDEYYLALGDSGEVFYVSPEEIKICIGWNDELEYNEEDSEIEE